MNGSLVLAMVWPALAIALNPVPVIAAVEMLHTGRPRLTGSVFALTMLTVMVLTAVVVSQLFGRRSASSDDSASIGAAVIDLVVGLVFIVAFLRQRAQPKDVGPEGPAWLQRIEHVGPLGACVAGMALVNYALIPPPIATILTANAGKTESLTALLVFVVLALSTVAVPVVMYLVAADWTQAHLLVPLRAYLVRHMRVILLVLFAVIGVAFTAKGIVEVIDL